MWPTSASILLPLCSNFISDGMSLRAVGSKSKTEASVWIVTPASFALTDLKSTTCAFNGLISLGSQAYKLGAIC